MPPTKPLSQKLNKFCGVFGKNKIFTIDGKTFKYAPITSCDVELSFSIYKKSYHIVAEVFRSNLLRCSLRCRATMPQ